MTVRAVAGVLGAVLAATGAAQAAGKAASGRESYVAFLAGSWHVGNDDLNNITPGITFGQRGSWSAPGREWHIEGGVFFNSYREVSPLVLAGLSTEIAQIGAGRVRLGASVGTAYYKELSGTLQDTYNIPNIAGFIPIVAVTGSVRLDSADIRLSVVPPGEDTIAIFNLSFSTRF